MKIKYQMTEREKEIVRLVALGYKDREISEQLDLSCKHITDYLCKMRARLGIPNRAGLVTAYLSCVGRCEKAEMAVDVLQAGAEKWYGEKNY